MFFYYLPQLTYADVTPATIERLGLALPFRDLLAPAKVFQAGIVRRQVHTGGPDGGTGVIVAPQPVGGDPIDTGYHRDRQVWAHCGAYWLGRAAKQIDTRSPSPEVLARPALLPGPLVTLGDGRDWQIPIVRRLGRFSALPQRMGFDAAGEFALQPLPAYEAAWLAAGEIFDHLFSARSLPFPKVFALCVEVLALNYRVGPREVADLGLITTENYQRVYEAAVDLAKVLDLLGPEPITGAESDAAPPQKKTEPAPSSISPGPPAASPSTAPPAETCIY